MATIESVPDQVGLRDGEVAFQITPSSGSGGARVAAWAGQQEQTGPEADAYVAIRLEARVIDPLDGSTKEMKGRPLTTAPYVHTLSASELDSVDLDAILARLVAAGAERMWNHLQALEAWNKLPKAAP